MLPGETGLLRELTRQAIFLPPGCAPPPESIVDREELRVYWSGFGSRETDLCTAAEAGGRIAGACWTRIMEDYGHLDDETPSLAIALFPEYRGMGIGTALLREHLALMKSQGFRGVSLSVQKQNYALKLYMANGFRPVRENGEELIMLCALR
ncbi:MAG: GNAT family N-acetyltransferase [Abditibacteriota bacterium]|nr:GNAT family N-acetyltransferase [Abditibacteriota bacterium]